MDDTFYTPDQLIDARTTAIAQNNRIIIEKVADLYNEMIKSTKREINEKLMLSATTTWNNSTATECSLYFSAIILVASKLTSDCLDDYYTFNECIVNEDSEFVKSHNLGHFFKRRNADMLFTFDVVVPIMSALVAAGYKVDIKSEPDQADWGFVVTWKLT